MQIILHETFIFILYMDKISILNDIKKHYGFRKNKEFANSLGISPQTLSNWKARNTYDPD